MQRVLAVDYGAKRVGLACGDTENKIASAKGFVENLSFDFLSEYILDLCEKENYSIVVFGLPLKMKEGQRENFIMNEFLRFYEFFCEKSKGRVEIFLVDERLSSFEAKQLFSDFSLKNKDFKKYKDSLAAAVILQRWFDEG